MAYDIGDKGQLTGDDLLAELHRAGFQVKMFGEQAGLEDVTGQGQAPDWNLLWAFAEMQDAYGKELRLRQPSTEK